MEDNLHTCMNNAALTRLEIVVNGKQLLTFKHIILFIMEIKSNKVEYQRPYFSKF